MRTGEDAKISRFAVVKQDENTPQDTDGFSGTPENTPQETDETVGDDVPVVPTENSSQETAENADVTTENTNTTPAEE